MATATTLERNLAEQLVEQFCYARRRTRLYPESHRFSKQWADHWFDLLKIALQDRDRVDFAVVDGEMFVNGELLSVATLDRSLMIQDLVERGMEHIVFHRGVRAEDLVRFLSLTTIDPRDIDRPESWDPVLTAAGIRYIDVSPTAVIATIDQQRPRPARSGESVKVATELYRQAIEAIGQAYVDARARRKLNVELLSGVVETMVNSLIESPEAVRLIADLRKRDEYTLSHSVNVAVLSMMMGAQLQLPTRTMQRLGLSALLHDIGKAAVPEDILNKTEPLSVREWDIMQAHSLMGAKTLAEHETVDPLAIVVAAEHHAREDLSGYPRFHARKRLHTMSKIVAIADTYDALTSDRSYRNALLPEAAMDVMLQGSGSHFEPILLRLFVQMSGMYPVGTMVELDTGDLAVVERSNSNDLFRPVIRIVQEDGRRIDDGPRIDLGDTEQADSTPYVLRSLDPDAERIEYSAAI